METKNVTRTFKGKTEFKITAIDNSSSETLKETTLQREKDKTERHYYQRMLRAYLKGKEYFYFDNKEHKVLQDYK